MCHFDRLVYILSRCVDQWDRSVALTDTCRSSPVLEYMRQYSSPATGCHPAAHFNYCRRKHRLKWEPSFIVRNKLSQYLQEHWKCKHCKCNLSNDLSDALYSIHIPENKDIMYCLDWLFRYNIIMKFLTYQTFTTNTKKKS